MGQVNDARKANLASQLDNAVVEAREEGYWSVFIPGAVREWNVVTAEDEAEAKEKVRAHLESKIDDMSEDDANVAIDPDNMKLKMKATVRTEEVENG